MNDDFLKKLVEDTKISTSEFSDILNITDESSKAAIQKLVDDKVNSILERAIGLDTEEEIITAMIEVTVQTEGGTGFDKTAEKISKFKEVKSVFLMSGGSNDMTITIEAKSLKQISQFVSEKLSVLNLVKSTNTKLVLKKYKENGEILNVKNNDDERLLITP